MIHTVKGFGILNKAEVDVFLGLSCFFDDPVDVGNLISGSSAFSLYNFTNLKSLQITNAGEGVKKREASYTIGGNVNLYSHYGKQYQCSLKDQN